MPLPLPAPDFTLRLIGTLEVLGAIGLILPWLVRIRPSLTPIAAAAVAIGRWHTVSDRDRAVQQRQAAQLTERGRSMRHREPARPTR